MKEQLIMIIRVSQRMNSAEKLQHVFSKFGCNIRTRLGLHEAGEACGVDGLIILQLVGDKLDCNDFLDQIISIDGITAKLIEI